MSHRPNNPHPAGTTHADMWEARAELTHLRRLILARIARLLRGVRT